MEAQGRNEFTQTKDMVMIHEHKEIIVAAASKADATITSRHDDFVDFCAAGPDLLFDTASTQVPMVPSVALRSPQGYVCEPMN